MVRRRRYRMAPRRRGRQTLGRQPRERLLRQLLPEQTASPIPTHLLPLSVTPSSPTLFTISTTTPFGGKVSTTIRRQTLSTGSGNKWDISMYNKNDKSTCGAHPNSRFTAKATNCPCISAEFDNAAGCADFRDRIRRAPCKDCSAGISVYRVGRTEPFVGSIMASETTAAASGAVGVVRRDPMAMRPFYRIRHGRLLPVTGSRWARTSPILRRSST